MPTDQELADEWAKMAEEDPAGGSPAAMSNDDNMAAQWAAMVE
jgi:hypothetical protein